MKSAKVIQRSLFEEPISLASSFSSFCKAIGVEEGMNWADRFGRALRHWTASSSMQPIRTLSLFSGVGGLDIGFHDAGFSVKKAVEIDERFAATLRANAAPGGYLEHTEVICRDIREFHPTGEDTVDFIIGGPPCQSFSAAGRRAAGVNGTQDDRGVLFREYVRLLRLLRPQGFLFENVYGITGAEGGKAWESICSAFADAGYQIAFRILDAADYGVPQHRERMFIIGMRGGRFSFPRPTTGPDSLDGQPVVTAGNAVTGAAVNVQELGASLRGRFGHLLEQIPPGLNYSFFTQEMGHPTPIFGWRSKFSDFLYKADPDAPIRTLKAQGGQYTGPFHWKNRPFGLAELKRLQTIPDEYKIVGKRQVSIHQVGNSVPPQLARVLAIGILSQVFGVRLPSELPTLLEGEELGFRTRKRSLTSVYRAKAVAAIGELQPRSAVEIPSQSREYRATLGDDFGWTADASSGPLVVRCDLGAQAWVIEVSSSELRHKKDSAFVIHLEPVPGRGWALGDRRVTLLGGETTRNVFVSLWKAFEAELARLNIKADLVQLCEYYQYQPRFQCNMDVATFDDPRWEVLVKVVEGLGTREILDGNVLATKWGVRHGELLQIAVWLRSFGYEARNNNTNSQIPNGNFLVPYFFPTLTPHSVQLRKKMVAEDE